MTAATRKNLIHFLIMSILIFGIGMIPPFADGITVLGMKVLGVFIGVLYGWTFLGFFWTSCYGMLALCLTGYDTIWNIVGSGFNNTVTIQVITLFILVAYLIESGFVELVLSFFLTRKIAIGRPFVLIFMIFFACAVVLMLGLGFGGVFFCWAVMYKIFELLGYKKGDMLVTYMIYGSAVSAGLCSFVFPFSVYSIMMSGFLNPIGYIIPDLPWIIWNFLYVVLFFLIYIFFGKYILRLDVQPFIKRAEEVAQVYTAKKATQQQKIALAMMCLFLFITLIPSFLPAGTLKTYFAQYGMVGATFLIITVTSVIRINGQPITNWAHNAQHGMNWDLVIMFVATTPIANALESADSGLLSTLIAAIMPILDNLSGMTFVILVFAFLLIITQFAHNIVVLMALSPTIFTIANNMGDIELGLLAAGMLIAANAAFLTPGASSPAAAVHSNTDYVDTKQAYIMGVVIITISMIALAILYPLGLLMF